MFLDPSNRELTRRGDGLSIVGREPTEVLVTESAVSRVELDLLGELQVMTS